MLTQKQLARLPADTSRIIEKNRQEFAQRTPYPLNEFSEPLHDYMAIISDPASLCHVSQDKPQGNTGEASVN